MRGQITKTHLSRIKLDGRSNHHFTLGRKSIKKRENNDACGSYLGHPRVGVSTILFLKAPPLQIGFESYMHDVDVRLVLIVHLIQNQLVL